MCSANRPNSRAPEGTPDHVTAAAIKLVLDCDLGHECRRPLMRCSAPQAAGCGALLAMRQKSDAVRKMGNEYAEAHQGAARAAKESSRHRGGPVDGGRRCRMGALGDLHGKCNS